MAKILKAGHYDPTNLASVAYHFGKRGEDLPVLALLSEGADPNASDGIGKLTALHWALTYDRPTVVKALLEAGADANCTESRRSIPLMRAKSGEVTRLLLEAGADANARSVPFMAGIPAASTALMRAAREGRVAVAAVLLEYKADTHQRDEGGRNALMLAAQAEKSDMVRLLLEAGVEVGLVEASMLGDYDQVQRFLAAGADLNTEETANALRWAAQSGNTDVVALLLDNSTPIDAGDANNRTALMQAARFGCIATMHLLLERGADPNATSRREGTALMASVESGSRRNREAVEMLLAYGARADVRTRSGWTPLMPPCIWGDTAVVELLLRHRADPNAFTDAVAMEREVGCSTTNALMMAVGNGHVEAVKLLLQYGADPLAKNNANICALDTARLFHGFKHAVRQQILPLLESAIARQ